MMVADGRDSMPVLLAVAAGSLAALTVALNGNLALYLGNMRATVLIHVVGLIAVLLWIWIRREKIRVDRATPWYAFMGGALGVLTVIGTNLSYAALGVSIPVALMLLGQTLLGAAIDQFGLFGAKRRPFRPEHLLSFALIGGGIVVMLLV
jgi:bacterial/archaeal transporter family-2 protein